MNDKIRELYEKVSGDDSLKESFIKGLEAISNDDEKKSFIIDFAKEQGITLTMEDFPKTDDLHHISDDVMHHVAGGAYGDHMKLQCDNPAYIACTAFMATSGLLDC